MFDFCFTVVSSGPLGPQSGARFWYQQPNWGCGRLCSDEWPSCHSSWPCMDVHVLLFSGFSSLRTLSPRKDWQKNFTFLSLARVSPQASVISYKNTFNDLYLKVTKLSCSYCLLNIHSVTNSYLLLCSFCFSVLFLDCGSCCLLLSPTMSMCFIFPLLLYDWLKMPS